MKRLVLYFSYLGTNYRGLQRNVSNNPLSKRAPDLDSIQGILEFGLQKILQIPRVSLFISSRTDTGVHALDATVQFDLDEENTFKRRAYSPEKICQSLNLFLDKNECDIRIKRIVEVPLDFSCRRAHSRTYEFRVAFLNEYSHIAPGALRLSGTTSIKELNRCEVVSYPFDFQAVQEASRLFIGKWNFSTFMMTSPDDGKKDRVKTIRKFSFAPEVIEDKVWDSYAESLVKPPYQIHNFTVEGSGFLRRQVRRMVGALVAVGRGIIGPKDIQYMLQNPSEKNWPTNVSALGPDGLYLKEIKYSNQNILRGYLS